MLTFIGRDRRYRYGAEHGVHRRPLDDSIGIAHRASPVASVNSVVTAMSIM